MTSIEFIVGDATNLEMIPSESIELIITSPPYFGVDTLRYGDDQKKQINYDLDKMLDLLIKSTYEMERVLKIDGSIWINIGDRGSLPHKYMVEVLKKTKLYHSNTVIHVLDGKDPFDNKEFLNGNYWYWFQLTKLENPMPKTNERRFGYYLNFFKIKKYSSGCWILPSTNKDDPVDIRLKEEHGLAITDTMPKELVKRIIEMFSKKNDTVLDPFGGTGLVSVTANELERNAISIDISKDQLFFAQKRLEITKEMQ
jgi:site-specific DNA-methyltransferase (adenine-specific)